MRIVGIDPGITGAIALIGKAGGKAFLWDTPTLAVRVGRGDRQYNALGMVELMRKLRPDYVVLERQQAMTYMKMNPKTGQMERHAQGISSAFKTGYGYGLWLGILIGLAIPHLVVHAQTWQKEMYQGAVGEGKDRSVYVAGQLFPKVQIKRSQHGRADALLMADYGRRRGGQ